MIDEDEFRWLKAGRLDEVEARIAAMLFRPNSGGMARGMSDRSHALRSRRAAGQERRRSTSPQAVIKVAGSRKSRSGVRACVRYIARLREGDRDVAVTRDEFGRRVPRAEIMARVEDWGLDDDRANASKTARENPLATLGERARLHNVQAWHLVLSVTVPDDDAGRLVQAVTIMVDECFTRHGHKCLWALHLDRPGRPHVHVAVKAVSEFGSRLRFDIHGDYLDTLRAEFAECLRLAGLQFDGVRREDRSELRNRIATGEEALRPAWRLDRGDGDLSRRAPGWVSRFGRDYLGRRFPGVLPPPPPTPAWRRWLNKFHPLPEPKAPPGTELLLPDFARVYRDPIRALISWHGFAMERAVRVRDLDHFPNRSLAEWYLEHRPEVFGAVFPGTSPQPGLRRKTRALPLRASEGGLILVPDPTFLETWRRVKRLRRTGRDRPELAGNLVRLAEISMVRTEEPAVVRDILVGISTALQQPMAAIAVNTAARSTNSAVAATTISSAAQIERLRKGHPPFRQGGAER